MLRAECQPVEAETAALHPFGAGDEFDREAVLSGAERHGPVEVDRARRDTCCIAQVDVRGDLLAIEVDVDRAVVGGDGQQPW